MTHMHLKSFSSVSSRGGWHVVETSTTEKGMIAKVGHRRRPAQLVEFLKEVGYSPPMTHLHLKSFSSVSCRGGWHVVETGSTEKGMM